MFLQMLTWTTKLICKTVCQICRPHQCLHKSAMCGNIHFYHSQDQESYSKMSSVTFPKRSVRLCVNLDGPPNLSIIVSLKSPLRCCCANLGAAAPALPLLALVEVRCGASYQTRCSVVSQSSTAKVRAHHADAERSLDDHAVRLAMVRYLATHLARRSNRRQCRAVVECRSGL